MARPIGDLIPHIMRQASKQREAIQQLQRSWDRVVGKELARHTRPASLRRGRLYVHTDEPGAGFILSLETPRLLARLRTHTTCPIEEIVIRPGEIKDV